MEKYNYHDAVREDVREYIKENVDLSEYADMDEAFDALNDMLWTADSVTGNGSGSYTFSNWKAEENLCHNMYLLKEACDEFGEDVSECIGRGAEVCDVTIRCYLLGRVLHEVLDEVYD